MSKLGYQVLLILLISFAPANAMSIFLAKYKKHPKAKPEIKDCTLCHLKKSGGKGINDFGTAFKQAMFSFTDAIIQRFPQNFK